jgi:hypothetical protein
MSILFYIYSYSCCLYQYWFDNTFANQKDKPKYIIQASSLLEVNILLLKDLENFTLTLHISQYIHLFVLAGTEADK